MALVEPEDVVVVEAYVQVGEATPLNVTAEVTVFLHRTLELAPSTADPPPADVVVRRPADGAEWVLEPTRVAECLQNRPVVVSGSCYRRVVGREDAIAPGDTLTLEVALADGRRLGSETVVPGAYELQTPRGCSLPERASTEVVWSRSEGAWAYVFEALIYGLRGHFEEEVADPLYLLGLSVSAADTTLVFPREVGVFERFDLPREVALYLQEGLPAGAYAYATLAAADRNWVNWVRGGSFNPSGQVRVPSVRGEGGTGVFGSAVVRVFSPGVPPYEAGGPPCPPAPQEPRP